MTLYIITNRVGIFTHIFTGFDFLGTPVFVCADVVSGIPAVPLFTHDMAVESALADVQRLVPTAERTVLQVQG